MLQLLKYIRKSDNIHSLLGNIIYAAFSLITFLLMVRLLEKELYGRWIIYITAVSLLDMLRLGLTGTAAIRLISTKTGKAQEQIISASYNLSVLTSVAITFVFVIAYLSINKLYSESYYLVVLLYYPLLAFANLPHNQATTISQGFINFKRVLVLRACNGALLLLFTAAYILFFEVSLSGLILVHILANGLTSLFAMVKSWDGLKYFRKFHRESLFEILNFGKYSTASYIGSNLLRSSDTFILSFSTVLGAEAIAIYAIPLKFVELVEIPLRSFSATAFPKLSKAFSNTKKEFFNLLSQYLIGTSLLLIPVVIGLFLFSGFLLNLVGGEEYANSLELQEQIVYVIILYIIILPLDRYSGVALFAIDKPEINFFKIILMLIANIIFDLIAVFVFKSLILVALATFLFTLLGIVLGWFFIFKETNFPIRQFPTSTQFIENAFQEITNGKKDKK